MYAALVTFATNLRRERSLESIVGAHWRKSASKGFQDYRTF